MSTIAFKGKLVARTSVGKRYRIAVGIDTDADPAYLTIEKWLRRHKGKTVVVAMETKNKKDR